ncbi:unnamed protein product [Blumeria hordei]|uniref:Uncharacterized protein n=1 Tax=Blumeria hordei TaxID=2867405 RepID=A0A383UKP1_BLUHO|nr:unnamed protein product [Blumeria hordei]
MLGGQLSRFQSPAPSLNKGAHLVDGRAALLLLVATAARLGRLRDIRTKAITECTANGRLVKALTVEAATYAVGAPSSRKVPHPIELPRALHPLSRVELRATPRPYCFTPDPLANVDKLEHFLVIFIASQFTIRETKRVPA